MLSEKLYSTQGMPFLAENLKSASDRSVMNPIRIGTPVGALLRPEEKYIGRGALKPPMRAGCSALMLMAALLMPLGQAAEVPKIYYMGDCLPSTSPIGYISDDPALDVTAIPATVHSGYFTQDEVLRALRVYMPRTYRELVEGSMILLSDVRADTLPTRYLDWFSEAIQEDNMSLMMIGGILSFGGYTDSPSWAITSVGALLPVELVERKTVGVTWKPVVVAKDDPLITALPWASCPIFHGYNEVTTKDAAKLLAKTNTNPENPFMVVWDVGSGTTFAFCTDWTPGWGATFLQWNYYPDFTVYSVYYTVGREVPQDIELMHLLRSEMLNYRVQRDVLVSLMNFVEKIGANIRGLEEMTREADLRRAEAGELYVQEDYEGCLRGLEDAREELKKIEVESVKVKARAMLWIWMVEWMVVTSTLMIVGSLLWALMIRRRLYREVATTRATSLGR